MRHPKSPQLAASPFRSSPEQDPLSTLRQETLATTNVVRHLIKLNLTTSQVLILLNSCVLIAIMQYNVWATIGAATSCTLLNSWVQARKREFYNDLSNIADITNHIRSSQRQFHDQNDNDNKSRETSLDEAPLILLEQGVIIGYAKAILLLSMCNQRYIELVNHINKITTAQTIVVLISMIIASISIRRQLSILSSLPLTSSKVRVASWPVDITAASIELTPEMENKKTQNKGK